MKKEKSCGAVISKTEDGVLKVLVIKHVNGGHWGFPKGHVENGETELQTAKREILEETGLHAEIDDGFRFVSTYSPKPGVEKDVIYFAASVDKNAPVPQLEEVTEIQWLEPQNAMGIFTHEDYRTLLRAFVHYRVSKSIELRPLSAGDYEAADALFRQVHALHVENRPDIFKPVPHPYSREEFEKLTLGNHFIACGAFCGPQLAGVCLVSISSSAKSPLIMDGVTAYMEDLCVDEKYRRLGIGRRLFDYAEKEAKSRGAERMDLMAWAFNGDALAFYQSMGMSPQRYILEKNL